MSAGSWLPSPVRGGALPRVTATDPGAFFDGEPWIGEISFTNPGTSTPTDLTDSRLFIQFAVGDATSVIPIQTCDSAASDGSLIISDPANGKIVVTARPEARTWKAPYFGNGLLIPPTIIYGDVYRQVSGGEPIGLTRLSLRVVRSTGAPVGPPPVLPIGHIVAASNLTGALTVEVPAAALSGSVVSGASFDAALSVTYAVTLSGSIDAGAAFGGTLSVAIPLAGSIVGQSSLTGALTSIPAVALSGAIPAPTGPSGAMSVTGMYVGNLPGAGSFNGTVTIAVALSGAIPVSATLTGALSAVPAVNVSGTIPAPLGPQGALSVSAGLATARKGRLMAALAA